MENAVEGAWEDMLGYSSLSYYESAGCVYGTLAVLTGLG